MQEDEVLNGTQVDTPLLQATLYGSREATEKLSKRLSCAVKHLPLQMQFHFNYDTLQAIEAGVKKDPTLFVNRKIFLEGLKQAEKITAVFEEYLKEQDAK